MAARYPVEGKVDEGLKRDINPRLLIPLLKSDQHRKPYIYRKAPSSIT
jgi:hypothetical protein